MGNQLFSFYSHTLGPGLVFMNFHLEFSQELLISIILHHMIVTRELVNVFAIFYGIATGALSLIVHWLSLSLQKPSEQSLVKNDFF